MAWSWLMVTCCVQMMSVPFCITKFVLSESGSGGPLQYYSIFFICCAYRIFSILCWSASALNVTLCCYLLGDFNINLLKVANHRGSEEFLNLLYSHSFYPLIDKPTRITSETATLIDNIFTNAYPSSVLSASIWLTDISDHLPVCCQLDIKLHRPKSISVNKAKRSITEESLLHFKDKLGLIDWNVSSSNLDVNILYDNFSSKFSETYNL